MFVDDEVFDIVLVVLETMADQNCKVAFALAEFYIQYFILNSLLVKSNVNLYSVNDFQIFMLVNYETFLLSKNKTFHGFAIY